MDATLCNSCEECSKVCPVNVPDEFQEGLSSRKAIYIQFPQAVRLLVINKPLKSALYIGIIFSKTQM